MSLDITGIGAVSELVSKAIDKVWPDKTQQEKDELAAAVSLVQGQMAVNQAEASNPSVFVSGWRPAVGWVCASTCAWNWIGVSVVNAFADYVGHHISISTIATSEVMPILLGILGLRTFEKTQGIARK